MKLRNRKSYMTSLPEGKPPENVRPRITQMIYYTILLLVVGYIIFIFASRYFYFSESGFVEVEKTIISASRGGKVLKIKVREGENLKHKMLLAVIAATKNCNTTVNAKANKLKYDIALNRSKLSLLKREINDIKNRLSNFSLQRALETGQSTNSISSKLNYDLIKKQNEVALLDSQIILQQQMSPSSLAEHSSLECYNESIIAPFNGHVHSIKRKPNEFTSRGAPLLILIANNAKVRIEAYLNNDQLPYLHAGDLVDIIFSDGSETEAKINKIYSSAYQAPEREWSHYKPLDAQVRVHLVPLNKQDAILWKQHDRMEVSIRGRK